MSVDELLPNSRINMHELGFDEQRRKLLNSSSSMRMMHRMIRYGDVMEVWLMIGVMSDIAVADDVFAGMDGVKKEMKLGMVGCIAATL